MTDAFHVANSLEVVELEEDDRLRWMIEFWSIEGSLAQARLAWLMLQSMRRPDRPCRPMPHDPQPTFWPSYRKKAAPSEVPHGDLIERVKRVYRVEDVAALITELTGHGDALSGKCPFHNERKGRAFVVWRTSQRWRCFGRCSTGGDVIDLVRECKRHGLPWK